MFAVTFYATYMEVKIGEDLPEHMIPKWALSDVRVGVKFTDGNAFTQHFVTIEKNNGNEVELLMGQFTEMAAWTNDITGVNNCVTDIRQWLIT